MTSTLAKSELQLLSPLSLPSHLLSRPLAARDRRTKAAKQAAVFIPKSNVLFCMCLKCGTTSLYRYMFGAFHSQTWCEYETAHPDKHAHLDKDTGLPSGACGLDGMEATAAAEMLELSAPELGQQEQAVDSGRRPRDPSVSLMNISVDLPRAETRLDHSLSLGTAPAIP